MVDRKDLYPGAVVTVRAKVTHVGDNGVTVEALAPNEADVNHMRDIGVYFIDILSVEDRPLAVGDRVRTPGGNKGRIAALTKGEACLVLEPTGFLSSPVLLAELTRIPDPAAEPAPAEKAMRFKVGDRVISRIHGEGRVLDADPDLEFPYLVLFDGLGSVRYQEHDLSPAPAEERAP